MADLEVQTPNKKVKNATKVSYNGVDFRSKLEWYCYKRLSEEKIPFQYEEHKFPLLPSFDYPNDCWEVNKRKKPKVLELTTKKIRGITYTPDFLNLNQKWLIECKGFANDRFPMVWKLFKRYLLDHNIPLKLYLPTSQKQVEQVITEIKKYI